MVFSVNPLLALSAEQIDAEMALSYVVYDEVWQKSVYCAIEDSEYFTCNSQEIFQLENILGSDHDLYTVFEAFNTQSLEMPLMHIYNNRQPMLVFLLESEEIRLREGDLYPQNPQSLFSTVTAYWSNKFFGQEGKTVNAFFREVSHNFDLQFIKPTFINENGEEIHYLYLENPAPGVQFVQVESGVIHVRLDELPSQDVVVAVGHDIMNTMFNIIWPFIDCSNIPRHPLPNNSPLEVILAEDLQIYVVHARAAEGSLNAYSVKRAEFFGNHRRKTSISLSNSFTLARYTTSSQYSGLGVIVHEIGHSLGLPDLYDGQRLSSNPFGLMSVGMMVQHLDPWSKKILGFIEPTVIYVGPGMECLIIDVHSIGSDQAYNIIKVKNNINPRQYFLIENRQHYRFDDFSPIGTTYSGILVWHIDEDVITTTPQLLVWPNRNWMHRGVGIAGFGQWDMEGMEHPFLRADIRNLLGPYTNPNSNFHQPGHSWHYASGINCHPRTVRSGIEIEALSNSAHTMQVRIGYNTSSAITPVTGININQDDFNLKIGQGRQLAATIIPLNASNRNVLWYSSNPAVASVNANGLVTPISAGNAVITATAQHGGFTDTVNITVIATEVIARVSTWEELRLAVNAAPVNTPAIIQIAASFVAPTGATGSAITVPANRNIILTSTSDRRILTQLTGRERHFMIGSGASLTLGNNITLSGGTMGTGGVQVNSGGTLTMWIGSVIANNRSWLGEGGGVELVGSGSSIGTRAVFNMDGGTIRNNMATHGGGGVFLGTNSHMTMSSGAITNNDAFLIGGGGIKLGDPSSVFNMVGGTITGNTAFSAGGGNGGGIFWSSLSALESMTIAPQAIVRHNTAPQTRINDQLNLDHNINANGRINPQGITPGFTHAFNNHDIRTDAEIIITPSKTITFHFYDGTGDYVIVPMTSGLSLSPEALKPIIERVTSYGDANGYAFWGWFTDEDLAAENRIMNGHRRPTVGTEGVTIPTSFTQAEFEALAINGNIDLYAIWALWGDLNDDGIVTMADSSILLTYISGSPDYVLFNRQSAKVTRGPAVSVADLNRLRLYLSGFHVAGVPVLLGPPVGQITSPDDEIRFELSHEYGKMGEYVFKQFRVVENTSIGFSNVSFELQFDTNVLEFIGLSPRVERDNLPSTGRFRMFYDMMRADGYTDEEICADFTSMGFNLSGGNHSANGMMRPITIHNPDQDSSIIRFIWGLDSGVGTMYMGADLYMELKFRIRDDAPVGVSDLYIAAPATGGVLTLFGRAAFNVADGSVTVSSLRANNEDEYNIDTGNNILDVRITAPLSEEAFDGAGENIPAFGGVASSEEELE